MYLADAHSRLFLFGEESRCTDRDIYMSPMRDIDTCGHIYSHTRRKTRRTEERGWTDMPEHSLRCEDHKQPDAAETATCGKRKRRRRRRREGGTLAGGRHSEERNLVENRLVPRRTILIKVKIELWNKRLQLLRSLQRRKTCRNYRSGCRRRLLFFFSSFQRISIAI